MDKTNLCRICDNYIIDQKCDIEDKCILMSIQKENIELKKQVVELKKKLTLKGATEDYGNRKND